MQKNVKQDFEFLLNEVSKKMEDVEEGKICDICRKFISVLDSELDGAIWKDQSMNQELAVSDRSGRGERPLGA